MELALNDEDRAFAQEVRAFLDRELSDELRAAGRWMTSVYGDHDASMEWQRRLHARGWAAPNWPKQHGGAEFSVTQRFIFARECALAGAPPLSPMGIAMCGPALIGHGSPGQQAHYLPRILTGEHFWCQGYSEPQAGSDLAPLQMRAVRDGDHLVCSGTKIWTTHANVANWIFCLVRTGNYDRPQLGITFLLIPMDSPGVEVRPIVMTSGEHIQNQIFFDSVRVPVANVVGEIDQGWTVAKYLLEFERGGSAYAPGLQVKLERIREIARENGLLGDRLFAWRLAAAQVRIEVLEVYELRALSAAARGGRPGLSGSIMKILGTELSQHLTELAVEAVGPYGLTFQPDAGAAGGPNLIPHSPGLRGPQEAAVAPLRYLNDRACSIYAGSNEIQRNIIAKAQLGL
ncbi:acyl-CoA dehydrogenase family protein [Novosphingobium sp.]|uniref:acyl-CoA dehydrogenase family protein n=1 Tax=Novosphingobium sp. TaxID=1874826 RepID=UPI0022C3AB1C|nr:acyl-CoA dehydrogenase family protein [Novosphingobium sp.]MCZ8019041.1 acyl-CoA dehydrogenase family protein [Novosphingobium sp.]MCZ8034849.1 acyl-CoA dehydrogenase family protein [Novosphingobium sp.]MCZ8052417.1 acyl-CoA dehydrogenase family protein [Novosphingobium sp.]MCZ8058516.1 acyl-CoA dehydrogenase family protein [Novosphingobium sp.]MCZ8232913.1 acyl-CoA dehydrogenase family protein [Novosphingobium sp.]